MCNPVHLPPGIELTPVTRFDLMWSDRGSGANDDGSFYRPVPSPGYFSLGDYAQRGYDPPAPRGTVYAARSMTKGGINALARPVDYRLVWTDKGSGAHEDGSFWMPVPPPGYHALGLVAQRGYEKPSLDAVMCVYDAYVAAATCGPAIWSDRKSGAHADFGSWQVVGTEPMALSNNTFVGVNAYDPPSDNAMFHALTADPKLVAFTHALAGPMPMLERLSFKTTRRSISFAKNGFPLDYHTIAGHRWQHLQDMIRLPDANGHEHYMGTFSQNCADAEGGMVFVGQVPAGGTSGKVIWCDELNNQHLAGGFNHPGDLRRIGNMVVIAGQNWDGGSISTSSGEDFFKSLGSQIGQGFAAPMHRGYGGQAILFYDVSSPSGPRYVGKLSVYWQGGQLVSMDANGDIDEVTAAKSGDWYYLSFNGARCRAKLFLPSARWELIASGSDGSPSPVQYSIGGRSIVGGASLAGSEVVFDELVFQPEPVLGQATRSVKRTEVTKVPAPLGFGAVDGDTFSLSTLPGGAGSVVIARVASDSTIDIEEVGTT